MSEEKTGSGFRNGLHRFGRSNIVLLVFSLLIALFLWVYIVSSIDSDFSEKFSNIPVEIDPSGSLAESYGLTLLSPDPDETSLTVDAEVFGARADIGGLSSSDLEAYVDFSDESLSDIVGVQSLPIRLRTKDGAGLREYTLSEQTLEVTLDRFETRSFPVGEVAHSLTGADGEVVIDSENITCEPGEVSIYGPTEALSKVDHIKVTIEEAEQIAETKTYTETSYTLMDEDGKEISDRSFQVQATRFSVKVPVYFTRTLPVSVDLFNPPSGLSQDFLLSRIRLNTDKDYTLPAYEGEHLMITIETSDASKKAMLDAMDTWSIGSVSPYELSIGGSTLEMPVTMDEGFEDRSNLGTVYVSLDDTNLVAESRWINNSDIQMMNGSAKYNYSIGAGRTAVTIVGTPESVAAVTSDSLRAAVNLYNIAQDSTGTLQQAVMVTLPPGAGDVWISPQPKVNVTVEDAARTTTAAADEE